MHPDFETGLESLSYDPRRGSKVDFLTILESPKCTSSNRFTPFFHPKYRDENRIDPVFPFVQSVHKPKIARPACQAIERKSFVLVGGSGPVPNRLLYLDLRQCGGLDLFQSFQEGTLPLVRQGSRYHLRLPPELQDSWQDQTAQLLIQYLIVLAKNRLNLAP